MSISSGQQAGSGQHPIRVFVLDDHEVFRRGLRALLGTEPDIEVAGEAGTAAEALAVMRGLAPDVAVLDVRLPDGDGVAVCREIRSSLSGTACLVLTAHRDDQALLGAIMAGAAGYVLKHAAGDELVAAVRTVASGQSTLDPVAAQRVMERLRTGTASADPLAGLSDQERRVLALIGEGLTNRQIAQRMSIAEKTAKNYVASIFTKLGMHRRSQAAVLAAKLAGEGAGLSRAAWPAVRPPAGFHGPGAGAGALPAGWRVRWARHSG
jgi:two-component system, NarL family, response regulator DevR